MSRSEGGSPSEAALKFQKSMEVQEKKKHQEELKWEQMKREQNADEVIKEWLRDRMRRKMKGVKKLRDQIRADKKFLGTLQSSKASQVKTEDPSAKTMVNLAMYSPRHEKVVRTVGVC